MQTIPASPTRFSPLADVVVADPSARFLCREGSYAGTFREVLPLLGTPHVDYWGMDEKGEGAWYFQTPAGPAGVWDYRCGNLSMGGSPKARDYLRRHLDALLGRDTTAHPDNNSAGFYSLLAGAALSA